MKHIYINACNFCSKLLTQEVWFEHNNNLTSPSLFLYLGFFYFLFLLFLLFWVFHSNSLYITIFISLLTSLRNQSRAYYQHIITRTHNTFIFNMLIIKAIVKLTFFKVNSKNKWIKSFILLSRRLFKTFVRTF